MKGVQHLTKILAPHAAEINITNWAGPGERIMHEHLSFKFPKAKIKYQNENLKL